MCDAKSIEKLQAERDKLQAENERLKKYAACITIQRNRASDWKRKAEAAEQQRDQLQAEVRCVKRLAGWEPDDDRTADVAATELTDQIAELQAEVEKLRSQVVHWSAELGEIVIGDNGGWLYQPLPLPSSIRLPDEKAGDA